jgi:hypothetical protein
MSLDDQNNYGASIGFQKDDALGTTYLKQVPADLEVK